MGIPEREIIRAVLSEMGEDTRLFRINAGMGWAGKARRLKSGAMVVRNPYPLHAAPEGWPDLCGWRSVVVTPEMVGSTVAVFQAVEVKSKGVRVSARQRLLLALMRRMGCEVRVVHDGVTVDTSASRDSASGEPLARSSGKPR